MKTILVLLAVLVAALCYHSAVASELLTQAENEKIWNAYRGALYDKLFNLYCNARGGCNGRQVFQMVDSAIDVHNIHDAFFLNEQLCKFTPKIGAAFDFTCTTEDCSFSTNMKNAIVKVPPTVAGSKGAEAFSAFRNAPTVRAGSVEKSYPWSITGTKTMCSMAGCNPGVMNLVNMIHIKETYPKDHLIYNGKKYFFREQKKGAGALADSEEEAIPMSLSASSGDAVEEIETQTDFLFRRRRSAPPPPPQPIPVPYNQFEMKLEAHDIDIHFVQPGQWFNRGFLSEFANTLHGEFFADNGKMPLLNHGVLVARQPKVTLKITRVTYEQLSNELRAGVISTLKVGGLEFKGDEIKSLGDDEFEIHNGVEGTGDIIKFVPIYAADEAASPSEQDLAVAKKYGKKQRLINDNTEGVEEIETTSEFLFRRRRRSPPPPPPPPPKPTTYSHHLVMQARTAQVLAVVSERLP